MSEPIESPEIGQAWWKPSYPFPTVVKIIGTDGENVTVKWERRRPVKLSVSLFLSQGFRRQEEAKP